MEDFDLNDDRADCIDFDAVFADEHAPAAAQLPTQAQVNAHLAYLKANNPALYLCLGTMVRAFQKGVSETAPYRAVEGAGKAIRRTLHETEVI